VRAVASVRNFPRVGSIDFQNRTSLRYLLKREKARVAELTGNWPHTSRDLEGCALVDVAVE
jgi:hypothetical protein